MQEGLATYIAFLRAVAIKQAVDAVQIIIAPGVADLTFLAEFAGMRFGEIDALRRARMARQEVQALVGVGVCRHEAAVVFHGIEEAGCGVRVIAGLAERADADLVGLQLLLAREGGEPQLAAGECLLAGQIARQDLGDDAAGDDLGLFTLLAFDTVIGGDVRHLMRQHGGDFRGVIGKRQQAAGDVEIATRQREGVDRGRVQDGDAVGLLRVFRDAGESAGDAGDEALGLGVLIFAAVACQNAGMLAGAHLRARIVLCTSETICGLAEGDTFGW